ncbi:MAG: DUF3820 family protein [Planctomycetes bacterium]|nr:DUF3820 family protein [Planctomycetota bacterium]
MSIESSAESMPFGKFKGFQMGKIPAWYLTWCVTSMRRCPEIIKEEVGRRIALGRADVHGLVPLVKQAERANVTGLMTVVVGEAFQQRRSGWLAAGGNPPECPFD